MSDNAKIVNGSKETANAGGEAAGKEKSSKPISKDHEQVHDLAEMGSVHGKPWS